ncbi:MAG: hypothetical protein WAN28_05415 [Terracidiphilus sp.]
MSLSLLSFLPAVDRGWKNMRAVCDFNGCHNTQLMRSIPGSRPGMQVGPQWYCSFDCFALAMRTPLAVMTSRRAPEIPRLPRLSLRLALHVKGYLSAEDMRRGAVRSEMDEDELAETLVEMNMATEKQIAAARSAQWGYPVFAQDFTSQLVFSDIPRALLRSSSAAPLHYSATARRILLGFVSRVEHSLLEAIEQMTGFRVEPCFITPTDREEQISRITVPSEYEEVVVEEPETPERMARTLGRMAVEIGAREAQIAPCKSHVWARMMGKRGKVDVLFRVHASAAEGRFKEPEIFDETSTVLP